MARNRAGGCLHSNGKLAGPLLDTGIHGFEADGPASCVRRCTRPTTVIHREWRPEDR